MPRILTVIMAFLLFIFGAIIGFKLNGGGGGRLVTQRKMTEAYGLIKKYYVDEVNGDSLEGAGIQGMVEFLDPHSVYFEQEKVSYGQAELKGNFDGIGIEFDVINDTLLVVTPLSGGPSAAVGIAPGDRILAIDSASAIGITQQEVFRKLRGERGTKVRLKVFRPLSGKFFDFLVTRAKISTSSIDAVFMLDNRVGYIRLSRFIATTASEFRQALASLKKQGMVRLVIDLRGNPGGFLEQGVEVADEFLTKGQLIVYTKSRKGGVKDERFEAKSGDGYEKGEVIVLVDKGSASASEILAGALQDNKRALVVGELSFGKGLVQRQFSLSDSSAIRLTVSRYYTPSGRQIQRVYHKGVAGREHYYQEAMINILPEKLFVHPDSLLYLKNSDVSVYKTSSLPALVTSLTGGKKEQERLMALKAAGGIIPDFWVTSRVSSDFYQKLYQSGSFDEIAQKILDDPRSTVQHYRDSLERFITTYSEEGLLEALVRNNCKAKKIAFDRVGFIQDRKYIVRAVKSQIAHQLFGAEGQIKFLVRCADPEFKIAATVPAIQP